MIIPGGLLIYTWILIGLINIWMLERYLISIGMLLVDLGKVLRSYFQFMQNGNLYRYLEIQDSHLNIG